jgi:hypothetical protein
LDANPIGPNLDDSSYGCCAGSGAACPATAYLPNTATYPNNDAGMLANDKYLLADNIYYKVNRSSAEAIAVGYVRSFTGALTIPEDLLITATEIQAAGFDLCCRKCKEDR